MKNTLIFKELIADFHGRPFPALTPRSIAYEIVPSKILTLTGVRRAGKTSFLFQIMQSLLDQGVSKENLLFFNFEDERLDGLTGKDLGVILESYYELYPQKKRERVYVFLDEIHAVDHWEKFVRRVHDAENAQIFLTGSSAKLLSLEIATSLRGRSLNFEVFPFNFAEFLHHRNVSHSPHSSAEKAYVKHAFSDYAERGGFPEVLDCGQQISQKILQEYLQLILYKDMIERHRIKNHHLMKYFLKHCLRNIASPLSIHKLYRDLKSQGYRMSKDTLHQYLGHAEDAYLFFTIPCFSESLRVQHVNYRKLYCVDIGLPQAVMISGNHWGQILENLVFLELRRKGTYEIFYYKTKSGYEIDFLVTVRGKITSLIQVSDNIDSPQTKERELRALEEAMIELQVSQSWLITRDTEDEIMFSKKKVSLIPFWKWSTEDRTKLE